MSGIVGSAFQLRPHLLICLSQLIPAKLPFVQPDMKQQPSLIESPLVAGNATGVYSG